VTDLDNETILIDTSNDNSDFLQEALNEVELRAKERQDPEWEWRQHLIGAVFCRSSKTKSERTALEPHEGRHTKRTTQTESTNTSE